jgi:hypothetical protein
MEGGVKVEQEPARSKMFILTWLEMAIQPVPFPTYLDLLVLVVESALDPIA